MQDVGTVSMNHSPPSSRLRFAELSSSVGAGVLGIGIGAYFGENLAAWAIPLLIAGAATHAVGMGDKHRLERSAGEMRPRWATVLYWICWLALLGLAIVLVARFLTRP
jgi:hypothetical protein